MDYKKIIDSKGLKQRWIAKKLNVSDSMISKVLKGEKKFSPENQRKFRRILGL